MKRCLLVLLAVPLGGLHGFSPPRTFINYGGVSSVSPSRPRVSPYYISSVSLSLADVGDATSGGSGGDGDDSGIRERGDGVVGEVGVVVAAAEPVDSKKSKGERLEPFVVLSPRVDHKPGRIIIILSLVYL